MAGRKRTIGQPEPTRKADTQAGEHVSGGTLHLIFIQVLSRGLTFVGNQFLLRFLAPHHLGLAIQLETLFVSVLYSARESLRTALQRRPRTSQQSQATETEFQSDSPDPGPQHIINLSHCALLLGVLLCALFGYSYLASAHDEVLASEDFTVAFRLYVLATLVELCAEPCFVLIQHYSLFRSRARAETISAITRCVSACGTAIWLRGRGSPPSVLPFAVSQLAYASTLVAMYTLPTWQMSRRHGFSLLPKRLPAGPEVALSFVSKPLMQLTASFYLQSIFKHLLTQGDTFILTILADLKAQGSFALASNYGGLVSRLVFQPIEESSRNIFGRLLSTSEDRVTLQPPRTDASISEVGRSGGLPYSPSSLTETGLAATAPRADVLQDTTPHGASIWDDPTANMPTLGMHKDTDAGRAIVLEHNHRVEALEHLAMTIHGYLLLVTIPCMTVVPYLFPIVVQTMMGSRWASAESFSVLQAYGYYLPFLAINGVLDAFVTSVATQAELGLQSLALLLVSIVYLSAAWLGLVRMQLGGAGLVYANILNMAMRIVYNATFIQSWTRANFGTHSTRKVNSEVGRLWRVAIPNTACLAVSAVVAIALHQSVYVGSTKQPFTGMKSITREDVSYLGAALVVLASTVLLSERGFLVELLGAVMPERLAGTMLPYLGQHTTTKP